MMTSQQAAAIASFVSYDDSRFSPIQAFVYQRVWMALHHAGFSPWQEKGSYPNHIMVGYQFADVGREGWTEVSRKLPRKACGVAFDACTKARNDWFELTEAERAEWDAARKGEG